MQTEWALFRWRNDAADRRPRGRSDLLPRSEGEKDLFQIALGWRSTIDTKGGISIVNSSMINQFAAVEDGRFRCYTDLRQLHQFVMWIAQCGQGKVVFLQMLRYLRGACFWIHVNEPETRVCGEFIAEAFHFGRVAV